MLLVVAVGALAFIAASGGAVAAESIDVDVTQSPSTGNATVAVTDSGTAVPNASVNVTTVDVNATYAGTGTHATDENGTVALPEPNATVSVDVIATADNRTANTTVELRPLEESLSVTVSQNQTTENATVTVTQYDVPVNASVNVTTVDANTTYNGTGTYQTDENGTVMLPAPANKVNISVVATAGNLTANTTATLQAADEYDAADQPNFGLRVAAFVHSLLTDSEHQGGIGELVATWVLANNPGDPPAHAGPPSEGGSESANESNTTADEPGPPPHAGPPDENDTETADSENADNGPPADAGTAGNETAAGGNGSGGPPDHAGAGDNGAASNDEDGDAGPPEHANGVRASGPP
jgi:hypothetical protein